MKTTKDMLDESRARVKTRSAERTEIEKKSFSVRCEARRANEEIGQQTLATVTFDAISHAERAANMVDHAIDSLERLRLELIQIAIGERWHQTERPPELDTLARELGTVAAMLQVRDSIDQ